MAQALFDQHPLEDYLLDAGETPETSMPGGSAEFALVQPSQHDEDAQAMQCLPPLVLSALEHLCAVVSSANVSSLSSAFAERFKYDVISSSLLSTTFSTPLPAGRRSQSPPFPGRLSAGHSRVGSDDDALPPVPPGPAHPDHLPATLLQSPDSPQYSLATLALVLGVAVLGAGYVLLGMLTIGGTMYYTQAYPLDVGPKPDVMTSSLETLSELVSAGNVWDSAVHEAIAILESEERSIFYGPTTPSSPSSSLRVALHSSLHTTQTQCDNVRQLFSALTAPAELAQLSEMYAPPSPMKPAFDPFDSPRPLSLPSARRQRTISVPPDTKRATWNGSYASLALAGSPTMQALKRREKRRSDLSALLETTSSPSKRASMSAPASPALDDVQEEETLYEDREPSPSDDDAVPHFGISALRLKRKQRKGGLESLGMSPPPSYLSSMAPPPSRSGLPAQQQRPATMSSSTRFTTMQTTRHPLSLSALHHALQGALASKRYACAHLLALRFDDDDDEAYWEDVRAVMGLLASTLTDAAARLADALDDAEQKRIRDETPSPAHSRTPSLSLDAAAALQPAFAPMPSHLSRFAAHVAAIAAALDGARENLEQCVAALRAEPLPPPPPGSGEEGPREGPPAVQAYEQLRRELGLALRECERGRERLLDVVSPSEPAAEPEDADAEAEAGDLPALGHDAGSDGSDKPEASPPVLECGLHDDDGGPVRFSVVPPGVRAAPDDATAHLLLGASARHLPPQGIEQVFEAETGGEAAFARERSKLTREERIRLTKARRESGGVGLGIGLPPLPAAAKPGRELWGPGGEVVQELKDVIWQVGERRRKMAEGRLSFPSDPPPRGVTPEDLPLSSS